MNTISPCLVIKPRLIYHNLNLFLDINCCIGYADAVVAAYDETKHTTIKYQKICSLINL